MNYAGKFTCAIAAAFVLSAAVFGPAAAESRTDKAQFKVFISGIVAGVLGMSAVTDDKTYAASGILRSSGLVGQLVKVAYTATSNGRVIGTRLQPSRYKETANTGSRESAATMHYRQGRPQLKAYSPPRDPQPWDVDPKGQTGTVDPMTAAYMLLRDVPPEQLCNTLIPMFDGKRKSQLNIQAADIKGDEATCTGEYRRLAGFHPNEMADRVSFPFTLYFDRLDDGWWRMRKFTSRTTFGMASAVRQ